MTLFTSKQLVTTLLTLSISGIQPLQEAVRFYPGPLHPHNSSSLFIRKHADHRGFGEILNISKTSVTVSMPQKQRIVHWPLQDLTLRAGWYSIPGSLAPRILRSGEWGRFVQNSKHIVMKIQPAAFGKLTKNGHQWALSLAFQSDNNTKDISWPLAAGQIPRLGQLPLAVGKSVEVFGTLDGSVIHPTDLAPEPMHVLARIRSTSSGTLSLDSAKNGSFIYHPKPGAARWLKYLTPQTPVMLTVNPITHDVLSINLPSYRKHCVKCLRHNTFGQVEKTSSKSLQLKTLWGSQNVNLSGMDVKIRNFSSQKHLSINQLPRGSDVLIHWFSKRHQVSIRILPHLPSHSSSSEART